MRGKDWFEIGISVAMVLVWLGVATLADRAPAAAETAAPPAAVGTAAAAGPMPRT